MFDSSGNISIGATFRRSNKALVQFTDSIPVIKQLVQYGQLALLSGHLPMPITKLPGNLFDLGLRA